RLIPVMRDTAYVTLLSSIPPPAIYVFGRHELLVRGQQSAVGIGKQILFAKCFVRADRDAASSRRQQAISFPNRIHDALDTLRARHGLGWTRFFIAKRCGCPAGFRIVVVPAN